MTKAEKLIALEAIWENLTQDEAAFDSPSWHKDELAHTATRVEAGKERFLDWDAAKRKLRKQAR